MTARNWHHVSALECTGTAVGAGKNTVGDALTRRHGMRSNGGAPDSQRLGFRDAAAASLELSRLLRNGSGDCNAGIEVPRRGNRGYADRCTANELSSSAEKAKAARSVARCCCTAMPSTAATWRSNASCNCSGGNAMGADLTLLVLMVDSPDVVLPERSKERRPPAELR